MKELIFDSKKEELTELISNNLLRLKFNLDKIERIYLYPNGMFELTNNTGSIFVTDVIEMVKLNKEEKK